MGRDAFKFLVFGLWLIAVAGCGRGGGSSSSGPGFWATDLSTTDQPSYRVNATKVAEGVHCYIYLEQGQSVSKNTINAIMNQFDNNIYPNDTATFGSEPDPGADKDPKIYILLLDIKDGYNGNTQKTYIAGYFDPGNEYPASMYSGSNEKEIIYMDTNPLTPASSTFFTVLAHEFQHMIHWAQEQKNKNGVHDDTWLNEAMSEIAPAYCGYGPSYNRVFTFENAPSNSLTLWTSNGNIEDYGVVYMWAQYFKDRFAAGNPGIFRSMLQNSATGIDSVGQAVSQINSSLTFSSTFRDWAIANYSGNSINWPGHPEWQYTSIDMDGTHGAISLPGLFSNHATSLAQLDEWSLDYHSYSQNSGILTWAAPANSSQKAALADPSPAIHPDLVSGLAYTFTTTAYLIRYNPAGTVSAGDTVTLASILQSTSSITNTNQSALLSPKAMLDAADANPVQKAIVRETGEPQPFCVHPYFIEKERSLRAKGAKPLF